MSIDSNLAIILSAGAAILSAYLRDAGMSKWANAGISLIAFALSALAVIWMGSGFSGDIKSDTTLFLAVAIGLAGKELFALIGYIQQVESPLAPKTVYSTQPLASEPVTRRASLKDGEV
jgi:hypothetical protein